MFAKVFCPVRGVIFCVHEKADPMQKCTGATLALGQWDNFRLRASESRVRPSLQTEVFIGTQTMVVT